MDKEQTKESRWRIVLYFCIVAEVVIISLFAYGLYKNEVEFPVYELGGLLFFSVWIYIAFLKQRTAEVTEEMLEGHFKIRAIIDSIPFGLIILDADDNIVFANTMSRSLIGQGLLESEMPDLGECLPYDIMTAIHDNEWGGYTTRGTEGLIDVSVSINPIKDRNGELVGKMLILQGTSPQQPQEEDDYSDVCMNYVADAEAVLRPVHTEEAQDMRVSSLLTRNLLLRKQVLADMNVEDERRETLNALLAEVITDVKSAYAFRKLTVRTEMQGKVVLPFPALFAQCLREILVNALLFAREGGVIHIASRVDNGHFEVSVHDNGIGMGSEVLEVAFEKGIMGDNSQEYLNYRRGRGLSTVKMLMDKVGVKVDLESEEGVGTRVVLRGDVPTP